MTWLPDDARTPAALAMNESTHRLVIDVLTHDVGWADPINAAVVLLGLESRDEVELAEVWADPIRATYCLKAQLVDREEMLFEIDQIECLDMPKNELHALLSALYGPDPRRMTR